MFYKTLSSCKLCRGCHLTFVGNQCWFRFGFCLLINVMNLRGVAAWAQGTHRFSGQMITTTWIRFSITWAVSLAILFSPLLLRPSRPPRGVSDFLRSAALPDCDDVFNHTQQIAKHGTFSKLKEISKKEASYLGSRIESARRHRDVSSSAVCVSDEYCGTFGMNVSRCSEKSCSGGSQTSDLGA